MSRRSTVETASSRFWARVSRHEDCWTWTGSTSSTTGYGKFYMGAGKYVSAHRFSYELAKGRIGEGLVVDHLCRNRICVNPAHLEAVTNEENILRGVSFGAKNRVKTECANGHPFSAQNTRLRETSRGIFRVCKECKRQQNKARMARRRATARA